MFAEGMLLGPKFLNTPFFGQHGVLQVAGSQGFAFGITALCITASFCVPF